MCIVVRTHAARGHSPILPSELLFITLQQRISDNIQPHFVHPRECSTVLLNPPLVTRVNIETIEKRLLMKRARVIKLINTDRNSMGKLSLEGGRKRTEGRSRRRREEARIRSDDLQNRIIMSVSSYR